MPSKRGRGELLLGHDIVCHQSLNIFKADDNASAGHSLCYAGPPYFPPYAWAMLLVPNDGPDDTRLRRGCHIYGL
jgi:hypothetical protein